MTPEQLKEEVRHLTLENIRHFPCTRSQREDFYSLFNRFGAEAARMIMIPPLHRGDIPVPSEYFA